MSPNAVGNPRIGADGRWLITRHRDVAAASRHAALGVGPRALQRRGIVGGPLVALRERQLINKDGSPHRELRRMVDRAFGPRSVEGMRPAVQRHCTALVERLPRGEPFDIVADFAFLLPVTVIVDMLGLPMTDVSEVRHLSGMLVRSFDPALDDTALEAASAAAEDFQRMIEPVVDARRRSPADDLISRLVQAADEAGVGDLDLIANIVLLVTAGFETTMGLISNTIWLLAEHPEQRDRLLASSDDVTSAIDEVLRIESPISSIARVAVEPLEIGGVHIDAGSDVVLDLAAANRDPSVFDRPDSFDITRQPNPHLAFGGGSHFCLGAALARLEGTVAVASLLPLLPGLRLIDDSITWKPHPTVHCPAHVTVALG